MASSIQTTRDRAPPNVSRPCSAAAGVLCGCRTAWTWPSLPPWAPPVARCSTSWLVAPAPPPGSRGACRNGGFLKVVSTIRLSARPTSVAPDAGTAFREDFLQVVARIGLNPDEAAQLVEASTGQPFAACAPADLLPILEDLLALAQRTTRTGPGPEGCA